MTAVTAYTAGGCDDVVHRGRDIQNAAYCCVAEPSICDALRESYAIVCIVGGLHRLTARNLCGAMCLPTMLHAPSCLHTHHSFSIIRWCAPTHYRTTMTATDRSSTVSVPCDMHLPVHTPPHTR